MPIINEIVRNHAADDIFEFIEVVGQPTTDYSAYSILQVEGTTGGGRNPGIISRIFEVGSTDGAGYWTTGSLVDVLSNGAVTMIVVSDFTGSVDDDLDGDDDGVVDSPPPWASLSDDVAMSGSGAGLLYSSTVLAPGFDGGSSVVGGASRIPDGIDTDTVDDWMRNDFDGAGITALGQGTPEVGEAFNTPGSLNLPILSTIVINEVDATCCSGLDNREFIELYDGGQGNVSLDGLAVVLFDGATDTAYHAVDLDGFSTDTNGYFLLGSLAVQPAPDLVLADALIHNGADAIALFADDASSFAPGTPLTVLNLVDAIVYDTSDADDSGLLGLLFEDQPQVDENSNGNQDDESNQRCANGDGGGRNTNTYRRAEPTPASSNQCSTAGHLVVNEVDYVQPGADVAEFVELFNPGTLAASLDGLTLELVDGNNGGAVVYQNIPLPDSMLEGGDYFVICSDGTTVPNCDLEAILEIQNGAPDAIALVSGDGVIDTISYLGETGPPYTEGSAGFLSDPFGLLDDFKGLARYPDGADSDQNSVDFSVRCISPGTANIGAFEECSAPILPLLINEVDTVSGGAEIDEFIEFFDGGRGLTSLDGLVVVLFDGLTNGSYAAIDLDGYTTDAEGYIVIGGGGVAAADIVMPGSSWLEDGADAVAVYHGDASDFPFGTPVTTNRIVDAVVYDTDDADDPDLLVLLHGGEPQLDEALIGEPSLRSNQRCPNGSGGPRVTSTYLQSVPSAGAENLCTTAVFEIFEIQGSGASSPLEGQWVTTIDNIVTAIGGEGFFIQTPDIRDDGDIDTSNGLFVAHTGAVAVGDMVTVTGIVNENHGFTGVNTSPQVTITSSGNPLPTPIFFDGTIPSPDPELPSCDLEPECFEGMQVIVRGGTIVGPSFNIGEGSVAEAWVVAGGSRTFREPGMLYPGLSGLPVWDGNPEIMKLDPDALGLENPALSSPGSFEIEAILGSDAEGLELWPTDISIGDQPVLPKPVRPPSNTELTIASLNLSEYYDHVDDLADENGRDDVADPNFLSRQSKATLYITQVLQSPDILAVQEVEKLELLEALASLVLAAEPAVEYSAYLVEGNGADTLDIGFLVRDTVVVNSVSQLGAFEILAFDGLSLFERPPLLLEGWVVTDTGPSRIAVLGVHLHSRENISDATVLNRRLEQAQFTADSVQSYQVSNPAIPLVVAGDFQAFEFTDASVDVLGQIAGDFDALQNLMSGPDLVDPNLSKQTLELESSERYSVIERGTAQAVDHALTSAAAESYLSGFEYGRGNADAPAKQRINAATTLATSDHDGFVLYLQLQATGGALFWDGFESGETSNWSSMAD